MNTMDENTMDKQSSPKSSLFDGWNAPPNLVTYSRIVLVVIFLVLDIMAGEWGANNLTMRLRLASPSYMRSEERRVGKEC